MGIKVTKGHKVLMAFSSIALILKIVAICSPGWFKLEYFHKDTGIPYGDDGIYPAEYDQDRAFAMAKRDTEMERRHHHGRHHHHHHHHDKLAPGESKVSLSFGLFYFVTCVHGKSLTTETEFHKCDIVSYCKAPERAYMLPQEMQGLGVEKIYTNIKDVSHYGLLEFRVEAIVGAIFALIGVITGVIYVRNYFERRKSGISTVICHIIAGVLFAVLVGKLVTTIIQVHVLMETFYDGALDATELGFPYSVLMAGIASLITLTSSFFLLVTLSKGGRVSDAMPYFKTTKAPGMTFGIISPPGYEPFHGLSDKKELIKSEMEPDKHPEVNKLEISHEGPENQTKA